MRHQCQTLEPPVQLDKTPAQRRGFRALPHDIRGRRRYLLKLPHRDQQTVHQRRTRAGWNLLLLVRLLHSAIIRLLLDCVVTLNHLSPSSFRICGSKCGTPLGVPGIGSLNARAWKKPAPHPGTGAVKLLLCRRHYCAHRDAGRPGNRKTSLLFGRRRYFLHRRSPALPDGATETGGLAREVARPLFKGTGSHIAVRTSCWQHGADAAREILSERVRKGDEIDGHVFDVYNESGTKLFSLPFRDVLRFH